MTNLATILENPDQAGVYRLQSRRSTAALMRQIASKYPDYALIELDAAQLTTKSTLMHEFAQAFQFPDYFGNNWDALEECLNDLSWLNQRRVVLIIEHTNALMQHEPELWATTQEILQAVSATWQAEQRAFVVLLRASDDTLDVPVVRKG